MPARTIKLETDHPFDFATTVTSHGWYDLSPHTWDPERAELTTAIEFDGRAVDVRLSAAESGVRADWSMS